MERREFLQRTAMLGVAASMASTGLAAISEAKEKENVSEKQFKKAIILNMVAGEMSTVDKFKVARDCGFDGLEISPVTTQPEIDDIKRAVAESGIPAHSIIFGGWGKPLSSADPKVADEGLQDLLAALKGAKEVGADGLLLVPALVNKETRYVDAYKRSQEGIKKAIPLAKELGVKINVEEVWNKFLLSPLEFARYIDEIDSPWVRAYFDVANVIDFAWPEDWIRTLGKRIEKIHIKDFRRKDRSWPALGEGDADFPAVTKALKEVGFSGWLTCELPAGDATYLKEVSRRVDKIIAGESPV